MTPERWQQVKRLFAESLERKPEDRVSFVAKACGDDASLLAVVESLLTHDAIAEDAQFLQEPAQAPSAATDDMTPVESCGTGLHVRCPHCHDRIELVVDIALQEVTCTTCGSHFSLIADDVDTRKAGAITTIEHFD